MQKHNLPNTIDSLNGAIGNEIGSGNIRFIQDVGQKVEGVPYLDKNTNKLHLCVTTTNSTDNDSNFIKFDLKESFNKLQNIFNVSVENISISEVLKGVSIISAFRYNNFLGSYIYIAGNITVNIPDNSYLFKTDITVENIYPLLLAIDVPPTYVGQGTAWLKEDGKVQLVSPFSISGEIHRFYTTVFIPK